MTDSRIRVGDKGLQSLIQEIIMTKHAQSSEYIFSHAGELALKLESLPQLERIELWRALTAEGRSEALPFLHDEIKESLLELSSIEELLDMAESLDAGDMADVIDLLPEEIAQEVIDSLSEQAKEELEESLSYDDDMVGRWIRRDALRISPTRTAGQALAHIKRNGLPKYTDKLFLIQSSDEYIGAVALASLLEADSHARLNELPILENDNVFTSDTLISDVTLAFRKSHFSSAAIIDASDRFLGRITAEDAITTLQDEADHQLLGMAGLDQGSDLFAPVIKSSKHRAVWLGINLLTAFLASYVIGLFENILQELVALAVLMPVVASMGGIAGSQTLTIVIRGLALEQLNSRNIKSLLIKELGIGALNGVLWAVVVGAVAWLWFGNFALGFVMSAAILINLLIAAASGLLIPLILARCKLDPALSGSVILTTVTDVVGFISFLGLAALFLINSGV